MFIWSEHPSPLSFSCGVHYLVPKRHCLVGVSGKIAGWFCFCVLFCPISCCAFLIDLHGKWSNDVHVSCRCAPRASANISTQCAGLHFWSVPTSGQSEVLGTYQMPSVMRGCSGVKQFSTSQESRRACCCDPCFSCALAPNKPYLDCESVHSHSRVCCSDDCLRTSPWEQRSVERLLSGTTQLITTRYCWNFYFLVRVFEGNLILKLPTWLWYDAWNHVMLAIQECEMLKMLLRTWFDFLPVKFCYCRLHFYISYLSRVQKSLPTFWYDSDVLFGWNIMTILCSPS